MSKRMKQALLLALKVTVSGFLLTLVFRKAGLREVLDQFSSMDLRLFALASLLYVVAIFASAMRWQQLLEGRHSLGRVFSLYMIGSFFNNFLPGAVGGDAVKAYYLYKDTGKGGSSIGSVFMDRYIGFFGLLSVGLVSGLIAFSELKTIGMQWMVPSLFIGFLAGSVVFFRLRIGRRFSAVSDFYDYFHRVIRDKPAVMKAYLLSLVIQVLTASMVACVGLGIGQRLSFTELFVFVPIISIITMVPLSISGLGVRESAFVVLFGLTGVSPHAATSISFIWFLSIAAASLIGLVEYLRYRRRPPAA